MKNTKNKREYDLHEIFVQKDETKLKELTIKVLRGIVNGDEDKDECAYFPDFLVSVPLELGTKSEFRIKDKVLDKALFVISNFEGDTLNEARKKAKALLEELTKG